MSHSVSHITLRTEGTTPGLDGRTGTTLLDEGQRRNSALRSLVDGLLEQIRGLSDCVDRLSPEELEQERQRFNLVAELTWAALTDEKNKPAL
jgi:hypothetical protein